MFRLLSQQALFKAVPRPVFRLSNGIASRQIYSVRLPYTGPPSYVMIPQRFSSAVDPQAYFTCKRQQEAKDRGKYVDIHDIGGIDPKDYDALITDVDDEKLRGEVAETVGIPYHAEATKEDANKVVDIRDCYIFGPKSRMIFPAVVCNDTRAHWVFFVVNTGSPLTYLSAQTSDLFDISEKRGSALINIAGRPATVYRSPTHSHFIEVNVLGMDFFNYHNISQVNHFTKGRAKLYFDEGWKMVKESKL